MNRILRIFLVILLVFLVGCSPIPWKLKQTSDKAINILNSELSNVNEYSQINQPTIVDMLQISETDWCLVHQITNDIFFASRWQKVDRSWEQTEVKPYTDNCNWVK